MQKQVEKRGKSKNKQIILDGVVVCPGKWKRQVAVPPQDLGRFASDSDFAEEETKNTGNPILEASTGRARGGSILMPSCISRVGLQEILYGLGIMPETKKYAAFYLESPYPDTEGFYSQLRIVTSMALFEYYMAIIDSDCESWPMQNCSVGDAFWRFICLEDIRYGSKAGAGLPELGYGLAVERAVPVDMFGKQTMSGVYRIWSRPVHPEVKFIE